MRVWRVILAGLVLAAAARAETTVTFQSGVLPLADYTKCVDTSLASLFPDVPFGADQYVAVAAQGTPTYALLKFDLADYIPMTVTVTKAQLVLTPKVYTGIGRNARWYRVSADWQENEATWSVAASGVPWDQAGGAAYVTSQSGPVEVTAAAHAWDVSAIVQEWVKKPATNYGVTLRPGDETADFECWYFATETERAECRPRLVITYRTKEETDEAERVAAEARKKMMEKDVIDQAKKREEIKKERMAATARPSAPWVVCELKPMAFKQFGDAGEVPLYVRQQAARGNASVIRPLDPDPGPSALVAKAGNAHSIRNVFHADGSREKDMLVRIKATAQCAVDANNDGEYAEDETFKFVRGAAGPITAQGVYSSANTDKVLGSYTFFVYARHADPGANDYWGTRHGGYLNGAFQGKELRVLDANDDWAFNSYGQDKVVIGGQEMFLNKYLEIGGQWYKVEIPTTGEFIAFAKAAELNEPVAVVVVNMGDFNGGQFKYAPTYALWSRIDTGLGCTYTATPQAPLLKVPAGQYRLMCGEVVSPQKKEVLVIDGELMPAIDLKSRKDYTLKWGLPLSITAGFVRKDNAVDLAATSPVRIVGTEGADYALADGKRFFVNAPQVEFYLGDELDCKRNMQFDTENGGFLPFHVVLKKATEYKIVITAKTNLFGDIRGEMKK